MSSYRTDEVFAISRSVPLNYVMRRNADDAFIDTLSRNRHIVLHGSSKQGKTSLRKVCLTESDAITIQCLSSWNLEKIHESILKEAGYLLEQSTTLTSSGKHKINASLKAGIHLPVIGQIEGEVSGEKGGENSRTTEYQPLELDLGDVNDVVRALNAVEFRRYIILEDFHYLPDQIQRDFAEVLKAYTELSEHLTFIVVGVWLEHDRLAVYNGDLAGRIISVNVDEWSTEDLLKVVAKGEELLNIEFDAEFKNELVTECLESVYIVQEVCNRACQAADIFETQVEKTQVAVTERATDLVKIVVNQSAARYTTFLQRYSDGFKDTQMQMHRWILYPILNASIDELKKGLIYSKIREQITARHPEGDGLNLGNLTIALDKVADLQVAKAIKPIIIDYDKTSRRLSVVDRSFLVWLANQDRSELKAEVGLPRD